MLVLGAFCFTNALPRINIDADVWGESSTSCQVFLNAGVRLLCTSDGVCVIVLGGWFFSLFWDRIWAE
jgi:hypothetical protein